MQSTKWIFAYGRGTQRRWTPLLFACFLVSDSVLATITVDGATPPTLTQVSLSEANSDDLLAPVRTGFFLPLIKC